MRTLFGTDGIRGKANVPPMTGDVAFRLGAALAKRFHNAKIVIGKDTRESGPIFESALVSGIAANNGKALLAGILPTPAIAFLTKCLNADAGIVISASHNPASDNGLKVFASDGYKLNDETEETIEEDMLKILKVTRENPKQETITGAERRYIDFVKSSIGGTSLKGIKIVLDCANGAAYKVAPAIFREAGAEVVVLNNNPNGVNINESCGALHPRNLTPAVMKNKADIGIGLDGDADRVIVADEKGNILDGDQIMYICAIELAKEKKLKNSTLIATSMSNEGLVIALKSKGIKVIRADVGDRYVIDKLKETKCNFGGEQSGHIIFNDYCTTGDGILCGMQLLNIMYKNKKTISDLARGMNKLPQVLISLKVKEKKAFEEMPDLTKNIAKAEKLLKGEGRVLVRYSGTENKARVMVEGRNKNLVEKIAQDISSELKKEIGI